MYDMQYQMEHRQNSIPSNQDWNLQNGRFSVNESTIDNSIQLAAKAALQLRGWPQAAAIHQKITKTKQNVNQNWWNQE